MTVSTMLYLLIALLCSRNQGFAAGSSSNCSIQENYTSVAYSSWPFRILCNPYVPVEDLPWDTEDDYVSCLIRKRGELVFNETAEYDRLFHLNSNFGLPLSIINTSSWQNYDIELTSQTAESCVNIRLQINITHPTSQNCRDFAQISDSDKASSSPVGDYKTFVCKLPRGSTEPRLFEMEDVKYKYEWLRNCSDLTKHAQILQDNRLVVNPVGFDDAGIYTCSVTHNGITRYLMQTVICVQNPLPNVQPSLECDTTRVLVGFGEEASFNCLADFGKGALPSGEFSWQWSRILGNGTSLFLPECSLLNEDDARVSCTYHYVEHQCYVHNASEAERKRKSTIPVKVVIRNVSAHDFGFYNITVYRRGFFDSVLLSVQNDQDDGQDLIVIMTIIVVIVLCFLLVISLVVVYKLKLIFYLKVIFRRYCGRYDPEKRRFGAFLVYSFSEDLDKFAKEKLKTTVLNFHKILEEKGFKVYDERRDSLGWENRSEKISEAIQQCHRVIVFVTESFIKDEWNVQALQKGYEEAIGAGMKLIFVLFSGMKAYVDNHADADKTCLMLQNAFKSLVNAYTYHCISYGGPHKKRF